MDNQPTTTTQPNLDGSTPLSEIVTRLRAMTDVRPIVARTMEKFEEHLAVDPVYAQEWYGEDVLRVGHLQRIIAPLTRALEKATIEKATLYHLASWMRRTIDDIERDLLDPSAPTYSHNSTSYISNLSRMQQARAQAKARRILMDALAALRLWKVENAAAE